MDRRLDRIRKAYDLKKIVALKPRVPFLALFALCEGLKEKDGLIFVPELVGIGDPEGVGASNTYGKAAPTSSELNINIGGDRGGGDSIVLKYPELTKAKATAVGGVSSALATSFVLAHEIWWCRLD